ncbi:MAG TPA: TonB-dependent receptor [Terracidiphilus sp.]|jgi:hypothetical protein
MALLLLPFMTHRLAFLSFLLAPCLLPAQEILFTGRIVDPQGKALPGASVQLLDHSQIMARTITGSDGQFEFKLKAAGAFVLMVNVAGFRVVSRAVTVRSGSNEPVEIRLSQVAARSETVTVTADLNGGDVLMPDPAVKVLATEDLLDANPGRPGAPISIPGYPIETASSGIKAPQYFAPGIAGDHGESIAMFIQVGSYLAPNNLSANAHGNGYTDPNIFVADAIESVQVDGGSFNVREGNHALNLAAIYGLRSHMPPFLSLITDYRDATITAGMSPSENSWIAIEGSYGNGFMDRLEHRKQFKLNGGESWHPGDHTITLAGIVYYGVGYVAGLSPIYGFNFTDSATGFVQYPDTIDPRQKDQTHTALVAANDVWKRGAHQELQFSGFFRTYNLSLFSDFGLGLIRQSEWRTVGGVSAAYLNHITKTFTLFAGTDYEREAPRRDDLDHYDFFDPANPNTYGPFVKIMAANVTIAPVTPYIAGEGELGKHLHYYLGWRQDQVWVDQQNLLMPSASWSKWAPVPNPKMTVTYLPGNLRWAPNVSASFGKSYFTEDPRPGNDYHGPGSMLPVEQARSYQLVASKTFHRTDFKLILGHETQNAEYGKIDSDQGLQFPLGPGRIRYLAATVRQGFTSGSLQATFEQADARLLNTNYPNAVLPGNPYSIIPEAPRLVGDITGVYRKLPLHLEAKAEFEYVGRKVVGTGCDEAAYYADGGGLLGTSNPALSLYCLGAPNKEFRVALARPFLNNRLSVGLNAMWASGYTGQTEENFACATFPSNDCPAQLPDGTWTITGVPGVVPETTVYVSGGTGVNAYLNNLVPANQVQEVVGVRIPSYASINLTWHFGKSHGK